MSDRYYDERDERRYEEYVEEERSYSPPPGSPPGSHSHGGYGYEPELDQYEERFAPPDEPPPPQERYEQFAPLPGPPTQMYNQNDYERYGQPQQQQRGPMYEQSYEAQYDNGRAREVYQQQDPASGQVAQQYFEYSTCQGRKKALLIGINYYGTDNELAGCINDARNVQAFICERFGYDPADIVLLTDDHNDPRSLPTRDNIIRAMGWLVSGAQRDDSLFFHYSGHGTQVEDVNGDEGDDDDEAICPLDFQESGLIIDDDSCRMTAIFDSRHSGTVMDLPYVYTTEGNIKKPNLLAGTQKDLMSAGMAALTGNTGSALTGLFGAAKGAFENYQAQEMTVKTKTSPADVIQWAGCKDSQTSADTEEAGRATGAMSYAFIAALQKNPNQSYQQLLESVRQEMRGKYSQIPQLSACHPIDTSLQFVA